jgi:hypothetical protein
MFNNNFDPLTELEIAVKRIGQLESNMAQLIHAHNAQVALVKQIAEQNTDILTQMALQRQYIDTFLAPNK